ncbi:MAG: VWA domain-containing protein [Gammaproteobacteria bacterium]|nr:VWA domain-containing protein [Gammaproteobacteria bacterium]
MLVDFFFHLKRAGLPVSITEYLSLLRTLQSNLADSQLDNFYLLARTALVKDESRYDLFDRAFGSYFDGVETLFAEEMHTLPEDWLRKQVELLLSDEEKSKIEGIEDWEKLMNTLAERLREQQERHEGGNKWIGTGGTSPFGAYGYNPNGVRVGGQATHSSAVKVWEKRMFRNLDSDVELGTRNIKMALRRLRLFAREGTPDQLDLDDTIASTARNAGWLDIKMRPEKRNRIKVLLFLDVGGSMDPHVKICEELFSAARTEFKNLEYFYFHNFVYESVWKDNRRRHGERISTREIMRTYGRDYKIIFVGDATMSPYEITYPGGSIEHFNEEPGALWINRLLRTFPSAVWLNPVRERDWEFTPSIRITQELLDERMYPLTLKGLDESVKMLKKTRIIQPLETPVS